MQSYLTKEEREKHREALLSKPGTFDMLSCFTKEDFDVLQTFEDENARRGSYQRIYPAADIQSYLPYFQCQSYCDRLLAQWISAEPLDAKRVQKLLVRLASQNAEPSVSSLSESKMWNAPCHFQATASSVSTRSSNATLASSLGSSSTQIKTLTKSLRRVLIHQ